MPGLAYELEGDYMFTNVPISLLVTVIGIGALPWFKHVDLMLAMLKYRAEPGDSLEARAAGPCIPILSSCR